MENIKLIVLDVDGTLIKNNSWYELNTALGITPEEDQKMFHDYYAGKLSYPDWIEKLVTLYKTRGKATKESITKIIEKHVSISDQTRELVQTLKAKGYELAIISGSFDMLAQQIADKLDIEKRKGNARFIFDDSGELVTVEFDKDERYAKVDHLRNFASELGIEPEQCVCIGDGFNNIEIFNLTKKGITFTSAGAEMKEAAWKVVDSLDDVANLL